MTSRASREKLVTQILLLNRGMEKDVLGYFREKTQKRMDELFEGSLSNFICLTPCFLAQHFQKRTEE